MQPLEFCAPERLASLRGLLADIDDTITTEGRLRADAYAAMEALRDAGVLLIPITGRPAGWCDHIARMWPVDAIVGENGAFWFRYDHAARAMRRGFVKAANERQIDRVRLQEVASEILERVPRAGLSADQLYREADLAIDFCEDVERLSDTEVDLIVDLMTARGMTVKVSSIHVNGWFGDYDKLSTTARLLQDEFGCEADSLARQFGYIGDSPNDEPMFGHFECSVGVANVIDFAPRMKRLPRYVTQKRGGSGFAEFAQMIISARMAI